MAPLTEKSNNATILSKKADKGSKVEKKTTASSSSASRRKSDTSSAKPAKKAKGNDLADWDVSGIVLPGEEKQVPVYDTCNDLRTKINNYMKNAPAKINSKAGLLRKINEYSSGSISITSLNTFLKKSGPLAGANSPVCHASYVYFEKVRIMQNKPKSKKREEMEQVHGAQGMQLRDPSAQGLLLHASEQMSIDKYGKLEISKIR